MAAEIAREVEAFRDFLSARIEAGDMDSTLEDCLDEWQRARESSAESIAAVREGLQEATAGLGQPYQEFLDELRDKQQTGDDE